MVLRGQCRERDGDSSLTCSFACLEKVGEAVSLAQAFPHLSGRGCPQPALELPHLP